MTTHTVKSLMELADDACRKASSAGHQHSFPDAYAALESALREALAQPATEPDAKDAARYRWLRDAHPATEQVIAVQWDDLTNMRHETLDAAIDAAMKEQTP